MKKGFSLIEIVVAMTIMAVVLYAVIAIFIISGVKGVNVETFTIAQLLAEGKLEEAMARPFTELTNFGGAVGEYNFEVAVDYVEPTVGPNFLNSPVAYLTNFKRITVQIEHPMLTNPVSLVAVKGKY